MNHPCCAKCGGTMTPQNARLRPELFLHDACLPDEFKPKGKTMPEPSLIDQEDTEEQDSRRRDPELLALERIVRILNSLDVSGPKEQGRTDARERIVSYIHLRYTRMMP